MPTTLPPVADQVTVPTTLMPDHQAQIDALGETAVDSFDDAYIAAQVAAHAEAVTLYAGFGKGGEEGQLQAFATQTLPKLEAHLKAAETIAGQ